MELRHAIDAVVAEFGESVKDHEPGDVHEITSGGERTNLRDPEPALFVSTELAVKAWLREMQTFLRSKAPTRIVLVDGPHLDKWNITVADKMQTHRVAEPRWTVTCRVGLVSVAEPAADEKPSKKTRAA